jgi:pyridoxal phosphate enzyme (YggS family)
MSAVSDNRTALQIVLERIARAAADAQRPADSVNLIAVSKTQPTSAILSLAEQGQRDFAENYLQEALPKIAELRQQSLCWHFIGQLQSNKTRPVAENFDWVHTVDRQKIAERLSAQRPFHAPALQVCVQVKLAHEATKGGVIASELPSLLAEIDQLPRLKLRGLMAIPPASDDIAVQRHWFRELHAIFQSLKADFPTLDVLSMGMSADLEAAILEGSTHIRIGTALFGARQ